MADRKVARRYAAAVFAVAHDRAVVDAVQAELEAVAALVGSDRMLMTLLDHPRVRTERKMEQVRRLFGGRVSETTLAYLLLLIQRRRAALLADSVEEYKRLADEARGEVDAEVVTAVRATREQEAALRRALEQVSGRRVRLQLRADPALVAGIVVRIGDQVIDASAWTRLQALRRLMREARVTQ